MDPKTVATRILGAFLAIVFISLIVGQLFGQPVLLSYVATGSMAPTLEPGDGFIAIPSAIAGPVEEGDVIVFQAQNLNGGGLITHRVVDVTDSGYITKGDANPVTDQDGTEPIVRNPQVVAKALQIGGNVVVIPKLGAVVLAIAGGIEALQLALARLFGIRALLGPQGLAYLLFVIGATAFLVSTLLERGEADRRRDRNRSRDVVEARHLIVGLTLILVLITTASMVLPSGAHEYGIVSSTSDSEGINVIQQGTSETTTFRVPSNGLMPVVVFLEPGGDGVTVSERELVVGSNQMEEVQVTILAPQQTGYYQYYLVEYRYLAILPQSTISALYNVHPWLPIIVIDLLIGVGFAGLAYGLVGLGPIRVRSRKDDRSLLGRIRRWFG